MELIKETDRRGNKQYCFDGVSEKNCRPSNMDSLIILEKSIGSDYLLLAAVSDGVGSLNRGAFAATALTRGLLGWFSTLNSCDSIVDNLHTEIISINREIYTTSKENQFETAATLSVLLIVNQTYYAFNAGDSRIYMMRNGKLEQITSDDVSPTGALTEYIGFEFPPNLNFYQGDAQSALFMLCSDGLYKKMDYAYLCDQLKACTETNIGNRIDSLVCYAAEQGERDNITIAVIMECTKGN